MKKSSNYYVIGGQVAKECYGGAPTLLGAKRLANKHKGYWGFEWHTPSIYRAEDVFDGKNFWGYDTKLPLPGARPVDWATGEPWCGR